jgi:hypothetical protein
MHKIGHELEESGGVEIPLLTVIAATRNRPADLGAALDTVKAQTFRGYELIVIGYAEAPLMKVATMQAAHMHGAAFHELESGDMLDAKLHAAHQARGAWVTFLHEHDRWLPGHLDFQVSLALSKDADLVSTDEHSILIKKAVFLSVFSIYGRSEFTS